LNPDKDKIVTFQYQALNRATGAPLTKFAIVKEWEDCCSEEMMLKLVVRLLIDAPLWSFVPIGNNLVFDFFFIGTRMRHYFGVDILERLMGRLCIDVKHVLVMNNNGRFKNYAKIIGKSESGGNVPLWYQRKEYDKIVRYVEMEAEVFVHTYSILKRNLPLIATTS